MLLNPGGKMKRVILSAAFAISTLTACIYFEQPAHADQWTDYATQKRIDNDATMEVCMGSHIPSCRAEYDAAAASNDHLDEMNALRGGTPYGASGYGEPR